MVSASFRMKPNPLTLVWPLPTPLSPSHAILASLSFCTWNIPKSFPSQGLCTCYSRCLNYSSVPSLTAGSALSHQSDFIQLKDHPSKKDTLTAQSKVTATLSHQSTLLHPSALFSLKHVSLLSCSMSSSLWNARAIGTGNLPTWLNSLWLGIKQTYSECRINIYQMNEWCITE